MEAGLNDEIKNLKQKLEAQIQNLTACLQAEKGLRVNVEQSLKSSMDEVGQLKKEKGELTANVGSLQVNVATLEPRELNKNVVNHASSTKHFPPSAQTKNCDSPTGKSDSAAPKKKRRKPNVEQKAAKALQGSPTAQLQQQKPRKHYRLLRQHNFNKKMCKPDDVEQTKKLTRRAQQIAVPTTAQKKMLKPSKEPQKQNKILRMLNAEPENLPPKKTN
jgi:hypothetical protein